jgi:hypothetical protein
MVFCLNFFQSKKNRCFFFFFWFRNNLSIIAQALAMMDVAATYAALALSMNGLFLSTEILVYVCISHNNDT